MSLTKITGAWVDGMVAPVEQAGQSLRALLSEAEAVYMVISDGHSELRSVTVRGRLARRLADLVTGPDDEGTETVKGSPSGPAGGG